MTTYKDGVGTELLGNILLGKTPTFSGWTVDPSGDVGRLTDGSLTTATTSGSKTLGAGWQYAYIDFEVQNGIYDIGGYGDVDCAVADGLVHVISSSGKRAVWEVGNEDTRFFAGVLIMVDDNRIRFGLTASAASTITPELYELWAVRVA